MYGIISTSLNPTSKSRILATHVKRYLEQQGSEVDFIDLREFPLPLCDGESAYEDPNVDRLKERIAKHHGLVFATPIYNYSANAVTKNLLELVGHAFDNKVVGVVAAAGGKLSYMSPLSLINSLMLDFRSIVIPRYVYATSDAFSDDAISDPEIAKRTNEFSQSLIEISSAVYQYYLKQGNSKE